MACTNITVLPASSSITITNISFGTAEGAFTDCIVPGTVVGKPIYIGFDWAGAGIFNALKIVASYTDYAGNTVTTNSTRVTVGNSGSAVLIMGRNYHSGTYKNLTVAATPVI